MQVIVRPENNDLIKLGLALQKCGLLIEWSTTPIYDLCHHFKPKVVFCSKASISQTIGPQAEYKFKTITVDGFTTNLKNYVIEPYFDIIRMFGGSYQEKLKSDVLYFSNSLIGAEELKVLLHLTYPNWNRKFRIIGPVPINSVAYLGQTASIHKDAIKSTKVTLAFDETQAIDMVGNGVLCLCSRKNSYSPYYNSIEELKEMANYYTSVPYDATGFQRKILNKHTVFHRLHEIFTIIKEQELADTVSKVLDEYNENRNIH